MSLKEIQQELLSLKNTVNELQRRADNQIIPGVVKSLSEDKKKIVVKHGSCETPKIKWFCASGEVIEYRAPSVGEQCVLLNLTGGKDTGSCIALVGFTSDNFTFETANPLEHIRQYPDGSKVRYNHQDKKLILDLAGDANINTVGKTVIATQGNTEVNAQSDVIVTAQNEAKITAAKILLNSSGTPLEEALNCNTKCPFTGGKHIPDGKQVLIG